MIGLEGHEFHVYLLNLFFASFNNGKWLRFIVENNSNQSSQSCYLTKEFEIIGYAIAG